MQARSTKDMPDGQQARQVFFWTLSASMRRIQSIKTKTLGVRAVKHHKMNRGHLWRLAGAIGCVAVLASCEAAGTLAGGGVGSDYMVARQALETGNYDLAIRRYQGLMRRVESNSASRLQLEYAHALLRGNRYDEAVSAADALISAQSGTIRASALAVRGTARHEAARSRIDAGQRDAQTRSLLSAAGHDLRQFLADHAALDSSGSMRARAQLIAADLAALG